MLKGTGTSKLLLDTAAHVSGLLKQLQDEQRRLRKHLSPRHGKPGKKAADSKSEETPLGAVSERMLSLLKKQEDRLERNRKEVEAVLQQGRQRVQGALDLRTQLLEKKLEKDTVLRTLDKLSFFAGVVAVCVIEAVLLRAPHVMPLLWHLIVIPLLLVRLKLYHRKKYHYFMLDFCYFTQALLLLRMNLYPSSPVLFAISFAYSNGPLLWAMPLWGNSFVFHSLDKVTSAYIHLLPSFVTYAQRWHSEPWQNVCYRPDCSGSSLWDLLVLPMLFVLLWCVLYLIKTEYIDRKKLAADEKLATSFRWLSRTMKGTAAHSFVWSCGKKWAPYLYMVTQIAYSLATMLPVKLMFDYHAVHATALALFSLCIIWNGANFYIEKFPKAYLRRLELTDRNWSTMFT